MIREVAFQTKARTVDHLGREQIADCPTAISELWKNAFDAYARSVELDIFDGDEPVAAIVDDGHGMNRDEFVGRWLVVGTESKASIDRTPITDQNGLYVRPRQGQKGIGRLSCANLGPILLLVSKRRNSSYVAALVDWRLFENPYINLADIFIPVTEFAERDELFAQLPDLTASLAQNVIGGTEPTRRERLRSAWAAYDELYRQELEEGSSNKLEVPSVDVLTTIAKISFEPRHLLQWPVWTGDSEHGTALLVSHINYDLRVQLDGEIADQSARAARDRFFETLSSFVDPFVDPADRFATAKDPQFTYIVRVWEEETPRVIVGSEKQFDRRLLDGMEHQIKGVVDVNGIFTGRIKAFGEWLPDVCTIEPPKDLTIPRRADTAVGPFDIYIASMEFTRGNTTHSRMDFQRYQELAKRYSGFMMFRDELRVLPYGRTDNDFFEIESRRSKSAGREFWNHRQMFGRLAITRDHNPNLKDKAGREGLLDNRAAKTLKELVANILMQSARRYFGSASDIRDELLPQINATNKRERAAEARNKLRKRQRQEFKTKLQNFSRALPSFAHQVESYSQNLRIGSEAQIAEAQQTLENFRENLSDFKLPGAPKILGTLEDAYADYRETMRTVQEDVASLSEEIDRQIERISPAKPKELLEKQLARNAAQIHHRIQAWKKAIDALQRAEFERIRELVKQRNKLFHAEASPLLHRIETGELSYAEASKLMELLKQRLDEENSELFVPYIGALESLKESIDLEHLATFGMEELGDLRTELERLNSLAQLGIAVEIVGHELQSYDDIIGSALRRLPEDVRTSQAIKDIEFGYEGLTDQLRFLSPLRLAGQKIQRWITGAEIADYLSEFFKLTLAKNRISFTTTASFRKLRVFDQQSRLYPVFINLLNNSIYWLGVSDRDDRRIILDVVGSDVIVSDNGPGVDPEDVESLFSLFFTKKIRGGRGVGLYLSRANLAAGGHKIRYEPAVTNMPLPGANFVITFRGAEFDGE
jgi:signal transduction histidine kinase